MAVEQEPKILTPKERGLLADPMIDFALVPNRRVAIEAGADKMVTIAGNSDMGFERSLIVKKTIDGEMKELVVMSQRMGKEIVNGSLELCIVKDGKLNRFYNQEAADLGSELLRHLAFPKS